jgi:N-acetylmuramoyl-L-alanine amidase
MFKDIRKYGVWIFLCSLLSLYSHLAWANSACQISNIRFSQSSVEPRIIFELNRAAHYRFYQLQSPERLVVDIQNCDPARRLSHVNKTPSLLDFRILRKNKTTTRLVFTFNKKIKAIDDNLLKSKTRQPFRLVMDVTLLGKGQGPVQEKKKLQSLPQSTPHPQRISPQTTPLQPTQVLTPINEKVDFPIKTASQEVSLPADKKLQPYFRKVVVVLDAGHGGHDPGALADNGLQEKEVTLAIARRLASIINASSGMQAVLTRNGDYFIGLRQRLRIARRAKGDVFISIHADSAANDDAMGASVYRLSEKGSSNEAARWLAEKENRSELFGDVDLNDKNNQLRSVLLDLSQTETKQSSAVLASLILQSLADVTQIHYPRVERAGFVVLKSPDIPSILIETGYISNRNEAQRLSDSRHQTILARSILAGLRSYLEMRPPAKSWFALRNQGNAGAKISGLR